jgi:hypothetical protein
MDWSIPLKKIAELSIAQENKNVPVIEKKIYEKLMFKLENKELSTEEIKKGVINIMKIGYANSSSSSDVSDDLRIQQIGEAILLNKNEILNTINKKISPYVLEINEISSTESTQYSVITKHIIYIDLKIH